MFTHVVLLSITLAAPPAKQDAAVSPQQLRQVVSDALRREATTNGGEHDQAVRDLVEVFRMLQQDEQLPKRERLQRAGQVRHRLSNVADLLERHTGAAATAKLAGGRNEVLDQMLPAAGGQGQAIAAGAPRGQQRSGTLPGEAEQAQQLIDLIQNTIAPDTWDVRGGQGTIMYFAPSKVLVIRQTSEVHGRVRDLSRQLRRN